jgi:hypothetical protein
MFPFLALRMADLRDFLNGRAAYRNGSEKNAGQKNQVDGQEYERFFALGGLK